MRRLVRPAPFARGRLELRLRDLPKLQIEEWPSHLKMARGILVEELNLQKETAGKILKDSFVAAHACARRMEQSALDIFQMRNRKKLRKTFARMARCLKRLPASQRRAIDGKVRIYLRQMPMDSERVETLIETLVVGFSERPKGKPSLTVLRAVIPGAPSAKVLTETSDARLRHRFAKAAALLQELGPIHCSKGLAPNAVLGSKGRQFQTRKFFSGCPEHILPKPYRGTTPPEE
jgi:hypothetical protein